MTETAGGTEANGPRVQWSRAAWMQAASLVFALALIGRAAKVQLLEADEWRAKARNQQLAATPLPAPRGTILDANGTVLVESRQLVKLSISPREVAVDIRRKGDGAKRIEVLTRTLARVGVSQEWVRRANDTTRKWVEIPGRFLATDIAPITSLRGVHAEPALERVPPANDGLRRLVGRADDAGGPVDGLEKALDAVLRGTGGEQALVRDARGQRIRSPNVTGEAAQAGKTVVLTINQGLQDIAERALGDAVATMKATGGDIVLLDVATGEVRAMASYRADKLSAAATAVTEPYEPGSTLKPFVAARLIDLGRARSDEIVNTHNGHWAVGTRKIEDDHPLPEASLFDVIRYSSNIGIIQFAQRLSSDEQYELLRDLGFGTPTGIPYPVESNGTLLPPKRWDSMTSVSLAMGYAMNATPLQLAAAYLAIANGGELLEPALVKEIRTPEGEVTFRHTRRVVRRVMSPEAARQLRGMLKGVVETGTAVGSNLSTFDVAGKTGTAKRAIGGKYVPGKYTASFVGMFPADEPQLVILIKLDDPTKSIYGGRAAAPVSKVVLQAAFAARDAALDRRTLGGALQAQSGGDAALPVGSGLGAQARRGSIAATPSLTDEEVQRAVDAATTPTGRGATSWVARVDEPAETVHAPATVAHRSVPDVRGLPVRRAVYELHRAGFRTSVGSGVSGGDRAQVTSPAAGSIAPTGSTVTLGRDP